jgi:hypothetical protein
MLCILILAASNSSVGPKAKRPPSPRKAPPRTPPLQSAYPVPAHRTDKPRDVPREPTSRPVPRESGRDGLPRDDKRENQREPFRETAPFQRTTVHRQDAQRQGSSRGPPLEVPREVRRDAGGGQRERDRGQHVPSSGSSSVQHRDSGSRRVASGVPSAHGAGARAADDARLKSSALPPSTGSRGALPPPPKPSEGALSSSRSLEVRGSSDARMIGSGLKSDAKAVSKVFIQFFE